MKIFEAWIWSGVHTGYNKTVKARNIDAAIRKFRRELAPGEMFYDYNVHEVSFLRSPDGFLYVDA